MKGAALLAVLVILAGSFQLSRPGYSVDEEFTEFAVRGIRDHGLPLLPSGLLYDRGLAYSYVSAVVDGRVVSLVCAALVIVLTFALVRRQTNTRAALIAAALVATSVPFWATATSARFYAPFLATLLGALMTMSAPLALGVVAFCSRLTHELSFLIAVVPFACLLFARSDRRRWLIATAAAVIGLALGQAVLFALHALEPSTGETMVRRFFLWQVLNLFEPPADRQFVIPLIVMVTAWILARRVWWWSVVSLSIAAMVLAYSLARATNTAPLSIELVGAILREGSRYPLDMFWHIARTTPLTLLLAMAGIAARASGLGGEWRPAERAAHLLWIGWVLWFGVIESGITTNYLLLPLTFMLIAIAIDLDAIGRFGSIGRTEGRPYAGILNVGADFSPPVVVAVALLVVGIALDQWRGEGSLVERLEAARPTINVEGIDEIRQGLQPNDRVACTDELGCLMLVGRIDRWLALDDYVRERFLVRRGDERGIGVYTGVPAAFRPAELFEPFDSGDVARALAQGRPLEGGTLPDRTLIVDVFKEYPIGTSRNWLPKSIEEDGLQVTPLLETAQVRVLLVSPPQRFASRQPSR